MSGMRSSLSRHAHLMREPEPRDAVQAARDAYHNSKGEIVLINKNWLNDWTDKKQLDLLAERALGVKGVE
jgi:hypothetical protein